MRIPRKQFDRMVKNAIDALPGEFARWLDEVPVIVEDRPGKADRDDDEDPLGTFSGPSLADARDAAGGAGMDLPSQIMIYRIPLMEACTTLPQLAEEIRKTLIHELGHYAGMDEDDLERHGYGPVEDEDSPAFDIDE